MGAKWTGRFVDRFYCIMVEVMQDTSVLVTFLTEEFAGISD